METQTDDNPQPFTVRVITPAERIEQAVRRGEEIKRRIFSLLGRAAVLVPYRPRTKVPVFASHQKATLAAMDDPDYLMSLGIIDRNTAVLLGAASGGVCTLDFDNQRYFESFLEANENLRNTLTTTASRGANLWVVLSGDYPPSFDIKDAEGNNLVEFRANKRLTLIAGVHPSGAQYKVINPAPPLEIDFRDIVWPKAWPVKHAVSGCPNRDGETAAGVPDTYQDLIRECGELVHLATNGGITVNQLAFAKKFLIENPVVWLRGLAFHEYVAESGIWCARTRRWVKKTLCDHMAAYADSIDAPQLKFKCTDRLLTEIVNLIEAHGETEFTGRTRADLLHLANGMVDITVAPPLLRSFSPDYHSFNAVPFSYQPGAGCPRFLEFMHGALEPGDVRLLQKWAGMALCGVNFAQAILLLVGVAKAGKGTFVDIITQLIGLDNCEQLRTAHLDKRFELARCIGKTLLIGPDTRGDFLNLAGAQVLKSLTGGDLLTAELKGENQSVRLKGIFNVCVISNRRQRVALDGDHDAWGRRLKVVEFAVKVEKAVPDFAAQLVREEAGGILNWMIGGLLVLRHDFEQHGSWMLDDDQQGRIDNLLKESDSLLYFVSEDLLLGGDADSLTVHEARLAYDRFCEEHGWTPQPRNVVERELPHLLTDKFRAVKRHDIRRNQSQQRGWRGVKLKNPTAQESYVSDVL